eukprot:483863_1
MISLKSRLKDDKKSKTRRIIYHVIKDTSPYVNIIKHKALEQIVCALAPSLAQYYFTCKSANCKLKCSKDWIAPKFKIIQKELIDNEKLFVNPISVQNVYISSESILNNTTDIIRISIQTQHVSKTFEYNLEIAIPSTVNHDYSSINNPLIPSLLPLNYYSNPSGYSIHSPLNNNMHTSNVVQHWNNNINNTNSINKQNVILVSYPNEISCGVSAHCNANKSYHINQSNETNVYQFKDYVPTHNMTIHSNTIRHHPFKITNAYAPAFDTRILKNPSRHCYGCEIEVQQKYHIYIRPCNECRRYFCIICWSRMENNCKICEYSVSNKPDKQRQPWRYDGWYPKVGLAFFVDIFGYKYARGKWKNVAKFNTEESILFARGVGTINDEMRLKYNPIPTLVPRQICGYERLIIDEPCLNGPKFGIAWSPRHMTKTEYDMFADIYDPIMDKVKKAVEEGKGTDDDPLKYVRLKPWNKKNLSIWKINRKVKRIQSAYPISWKIKKGTTKKETFETGNNCNDLLNAEQRKKYDSFMFKNEYINKNFISVIDINDGHYGSAANHWKKTYTNLNEYLFSGLLFPHRDLKIFSRSAVDIYYPKEIKYDAKIKDLLKQRKGLCFSMRQQSALYDGLTVYTREMDKITLGPTAHNTTFHGVGFIEAILERSFQLRTLV